MRTVTFNKKLRLNKKTIAHLDNRQMNHALGGKPTLDTEEICVTYGERSCDTVCLTVSPLVPCAIINCE